MGERAGSSGGQGTGIGTKPAEMTSQRKGLWGGEQTSSNVCGNRALENRSCEVKEKKKKGWNLKAGGG